MSRIMTGMATFTNVWTCLLRTDDVVLSAKFRCQNKSIPSVTLSSAGPANSIASQKLSVY